MWIGTLSPLVLRLPLCKMFALLQHHDLGLLVPVVFVCTPLLILRTLRNSWSTRDRWATRTVVLKLIVIVVIVVPSAASRSGMNAGTCAWYVSLEESWARVGSFGIVVNQMLQRENVSSELGELDTGVLETE